jgi:hypothetical protein
MIDWMGWWAQEVRSLAFAHPTIVVVALIVGLAIPAGLHERTWRRFVIAASLSLVGVVVPVFVFVFSAFLEPGWKGACVFGWLDCFIVGKLALSPLVLWALGAVYAADIFRVPVPTARWIVLGYFTGAVVSSVCFLYGLTYLRAETGWMVLWLLVPLYVAVWHWVRAVRLSAQANLNCADFLRASYGSLPCWAGGLVWAYLDYLKLPEQPPGCFVVTAASRGHESLVGPFVGVMHKGSVRRANRQLLTLWRFEDYWQKRWPGSHMVFRGVYNRVGPAIARRIKSPWAADMFFLGLKPVELVANAIVSQAWNQCDERN